MLESVNISTQLEQGFHSHAASFLARPDLAHLATAHPFDTHPPLVKRLEALGVALDSPEVQAVVSNRGDGYWYDLFDDAEQLERQQWEQFEEGFRALTNSRSRTGSCPQQMRSERSSSSRSRRRTIPGKRGSLELSCDKIHYSAWPAPLSFSEIGQFSLKDEKLTINYVRNGKRKAKIPVRTFGKLRQEAINAINKYHGRYKAPFLTRSKSRKKNGRPKKHDRRSTKIHASVCRPQAKDQFEPTPLREEEVPEMDNPSPGGSLGGSGRDSVYEG